MMYTIRVSDGVDKVIAKWKKSNPNLFKKYKKIYKELLEHPKTGLGHPEALSEPPVHHCEAQRNGEEPQASPPAYTGKPCVVIGRTIPG